MIQRIQTIFLLITAALMITLIFMPLATFNTADASYEFISYGVNSLGEPSFTAVNTWSLTALLALSGILAFVSVFFYKKRPLQIRCCQFNFLLILAFYLVFFIYWWTIQKSLAAESIALEASLSMPVAALILDYLAMRKIKQDENLVRSMDRIR